MAMTLRTDQQLEDALSALAESEGISRQEIIRRAVLDRYERSTHDEDLRSSSDRRAARWADVLERLGTV